MSCVYIEMGRGLLALYMSFDKDEGSINMNWVKSETLISIFSSNSHSNNSRSVLSCCNSLCEYELFTLLDLIDWISLSKLRVQVTSWHL
ncbi:hypothetical protein L1887_07437 [Cichorium endivia]|nr:hypothetical protein L1887_07437 [Cichorium endivia]